MNHVQLSVVCPVCNQETETTMHCLVSCHFVKQCWNIQMPDMQWEDETDFSDWLAPVLASTNIKKKAEVVTLCWHIWKSRNDLIWNNNPSSVNKVVASTRQYLTQWTTAQSRFFTVPLQPQVEGDGAPIWVKPQMNEVKISVDAAVFKEPEGVGFRIVIRDSDGLLVAAKTLFNSQLVAPLMAEALGIKEALSWCDQVQGERIIVETDCLAAAQAIRSSCPMRSHFGLVVEECRSLLKRLQKVSLCFVK
ncbi:uncharacterized protein LOC141695861 [Apium graveolens]|uniref:uncharacterized protein LOC141695861 n=1 Tax=Apium graveolens TaxID=4045 RepID=UPI003D7BF813